MNNYEPRHATCFEIALLLLFVAWFVGAAALFAYLALEGA